MTSRAYYNEFDPKAAAWLRELIKAGHIAPGDVDERSITEVKASDLDGYTQCHFFAGIGGWSYALRLADWPDDAPVWTASLPCQPWSSGGKQEGVNDDRHLWPVFRKLVEQRRPAVVYGEQVSSKKGKHWFGGFPEAADGELDADGWPFPHAGIRGDLEALGYAVGCADLCAPCSGKEAEGRIVRGDQVAYERVALGAPHIRQRLFWVADSRCGLHECGLRSGEAPRTPGANQSEGDQRERCGTDTGRSCCDGGMANGDGIEQRRRGVAGSQGGKGAERLPESCGCRIDGGLSDSKEHRREERSQDDTWCPERVRKEGCQRPGCGGRDGGVPDSTDTHRRSGGRCNTQSEGCGRAQSADDSRLRDSISSGPQRHARDGDDGSEPGRICANAAGSVATAGDVTADAWSDFRIVPCLDGKARRIEPSIEPLVDGLPGRVGLLRGYGNAIVPQVAAVFIEASIEAMQQ